MDTFRRYYSAPPRTLGARSQIALRPKAPERVR